ncbi:phenolic glucoside malonyltransferase 2-like [Dendrobium catenatum]|uniref:Anthocyanin 5-aromatic acyltransferase n=1 Tax=Dendrobium catenatum TaxID=906689 RepID=A0A2I0WT93_9ASPA|nr:phenolic glucoside malonyltransferase 2-like [Dendrobium catenatum]PKU78880.1 Anthocyanin 5-aromatic acyltransferase [Dendrobium catenatum]
MVALRVLEQCRVSPPPTTGPRPALPLTFFDIPWLDLNPVDRLFFYRFPYSTAVFLDSHLPNLKSSLALTLNNFYPLAGTIRRSSAYDDRFEICNSDGDSVSLTVGEFENMDFNDISGYHRRPFGKLLLLVPSLPKSADAQPLLAIQITVFPNQGLCLALKVHHAACDGFSSIHFLKSWAAAATRAAAPPSPPSLDRSSISDPHSLSSKLAKTVLLQRSLPHHHKPSPPSPTLAAATFTLPSHQIQTLKQKLQSKDSSFHISTFVISSACSWICLLKTKVNDDDDEDLHLRRMAHLFFSVDWRNRMRPPPPANYFGNCLGCPCFVKASVGDIVDEKDGFFTACKVIGKAIEGIGDDVYEEMDGVIQKVIKVLPHKPLSIAGSPKLRVYDCDFGWGKPEKVEVTSIGGSGAFSMAESRDDKVGVEIGVVLPEDEIIEFGKQFDKFLGKCD